VVGRSWSVGQLKDLLAVGGMEDLGRWHREGMRLIWQGRIVGDEEKIGEILSKVSGIEWRLPRSSSMQSGDRQTHSFYLVARPISPSVATIPATSGPSITAQAVPQPAPSASIPSRLVMNRNTVALQDTIHYLLFASRHHLAHLLGSDPLAWDDTYPAPVVEQSVARDGVMSVVRAFASERSTREEGWEAWEKAFEGDYEFSLEVAWEDGGGRSGMEREIKSLWASRVGRNWQDGEDGERVVVELE
jgi:hypothetical protein